jgi:dipeptidyl aminopeptidase/acylaminoacyl peptidase
VARLAPNQSALFGVPTDASSAPVQLAPTLTSPRGAPYELRIDRDSRLLVYGTDQDAGDVNELYAVPLDGSAPPLKLSGALVAGGDVMAGVLLVDGRALYRADQELDERVELYSVPLDGSSPPVKLSGALVAGGDVREAFEVTPDGRRVVYIADQDADERVELYSAPVDGSAAPVKLNATLVPGGDVVSTPGIPFRISPDGRRVVYRADQVRDEVLELYSVPIDRSGPPLQISGFLPAGGDVLAEFEVTADGREVLYVADQRLDDVFELFRTPIDRIKESRRASALLVEGGDVLGARGIPQIEVAPDSRVLYLADQDVDGAIEVFLTSSGRRHSHLLRR